MSSELQDTIKEFLSDYHHMFNEDSWGLADYHLWLNDAINLLKKTIEENNA